VSVLSFINYVDEYYKKTYIVCRWLDWTVSRQQLTSLGKCTDFGNFKQDLVSAMVTVNLEVICFTLIYKFHRGDFFFSTCIGKLAHSIRFWFPFVAGVLLTINRYFLLGKLIIIAVNAFLFHKLCGNYYIFIVMKMK
jgi:hypothetical protein